MTGWGLPLSWGGATGLFSWVSGSEGARFENSGGQIDFNYDGSFFGPNGRQVFYLRPETYAPHAQAVIDEFPTVLADFDSIDYFPGGVIGVDPDGTEYIYTLGPNTYDLFGVKLAQWYAWAAAPIPGSDDVLLAGYFYVNSATYTPLTWEGETVSYAGTRTKMFLARLTPGSANSTTVPDPKWVTVWTVTRLGGTWGTLFTQSALSVSTDRVAMIWSASNNSGFGDMYVYTPSSTLGPYGVPDGIYLVTSLDLSDGSVVSEIVGPLWYHSPQVAVDDVGRLYFAIMRQSTSVMSNPYTIGGKTANLGADDFALFCSTTADPSSFDKVQVLAGTYTVSNNSQFFTFVGLADGAALQLQESTTNWSVWTADPTLSDGAFCTEVWSQATEIGQTWYDKGSLMRAGDSHIVASMWIGGSIDLTIGDVTVDLTDAEDWFFFVALDISAGLSADATVSDATWIAEDRENVSFYHWNGYGWEDSDGSIYLMHNIMIYSQFGTGDITITCRDGETIVLGPVSTAYAGWLTHRLKLTP